MLEKIVATKKPVLLSSGMSGWAELDAAVTALKPGGPVTILQCASAYPCPPEWVGLNVLAEMRARYKLPVGFSDRTTGPAPALAAAALGATVIETLRPRGWFTAATPPMRWSRRIAGVSRRDCAKSQRCSILRSTRTVFPPSGK